MSRAGLIILFFFFVVWNGYSQECFTRPKHVEKALFYAKTLPLREMPVLAPEISPEQEGEKPEILDEPFPLEDSASIADYPVSGIQRFMGSRAPAGILVNVEGLENLQNKIPPDTEGDVGPGHYVQMINMLFAVFDKNGNLIYGPVANLTIWQNAPEPWSGHSNGDPIVLYDEQADRWLISELSFPNHPNGPYYEKIAISETSDPTGSWYLYGFEYDYFCDYPKIGVWHDGYYMTTNNNFWINEQWDFHAVGVSVFERDSMLAGSPNARRIFFDMYPNTEPWSMLPADFDGTPPPTGTPAWLAHLKDGYPDRIRIYAVHSNWSEPVNSYMELEETLFPDPFSNSLPGGIPQPQGAPYLASLSNRLMYRLQYRNFGEYQTLVTNHTINAGDDVAGLRWYEFRDAGFGWQIFQQGTYLPDTTCRWMGSIAMDAYGNMALGYSVAGYDTYPSIRFTGRYFNDPPGVMSYAEQVIIDGSGVQLSPYHRWGDYSAMSVDPSDQITFWYTQQYYQVSGDRSWQTRIASFRLIEPLTLEVTCLVESLCKGDSTQLQASALGGNGMYTFNWTSNPPGFESNEQNPWIRPDSTTTYYCMASDGVKQSLDSLTVSVAAPPYACAGQDAMIWTGQSYYLQDAEAGDYLALLWNTSGDGLFDDNTILHATYFPGELDIVTGWTILSLTALPLPPCRPVSDSLLLEILPIMQVADPVPGTVKFHLRPNPSGGSFEIIMDDKASQDLVFTVMDLTGRVIFRKVLEQDSHISYIIDAGKLTPGIYLAELRSSTCNLVEKFVIIR